MTGKLPYFPFYVDDFSASSAVESMTTEQVGAYILLLCKAWGQQPPASIPNDDCVLARWSRVDSSRWNMIKVGVLSAFTLRPDGRYYQERLEVEYRQVAKKLKARSKAGSAGAHARWGKNSKRNAVAMRPDRQSGSVCVLESFSSLPKDKEPKTHTEGRGSGGNQTHWQTDAFAILFGEYPLKTRKAEAFSVWLEINPDRDKVDAMLAALKRQKKSGQAKRGVWRTLANWLRQSGWEDEFPVETSAAPTFEDGINSVLGAAR